MLLAAAPAFADSDRGTSEDHRFDVSALFEKHRSERDERRHATSTNAVSVQGTVTAVSGTTVTLLNHNGGVYTISVTSATVIQAENDTTIPFSSIRVGDTIKVKGTLSGGVITATKIEDKSTIDSNISIRGTMSALTGSTITLMGSNGATYSVITTGARIDGATDGAAQLAKYRVGDSLHVKGSLLAGVITATKVHNKTLASREALARFDGVRGGVVTSVSGSTITLDRFGTGSTTVNTTATTFYAVNGSATTSAAVKPGTNIVVFGPTTTSSSNDSITASVVFVIDHSVKFLKRIFGN